jgi:biopolymer transport protein ExbD
VSLKKKKNAVMSEINITPFTDIVLVLLIIFMITTPMLMQPGIRVNLPRGQTADSEDTSNIEVLISKDGYIYIEGKQVHNSNVENVMSGLISSHRGRAVIVKGDREVRYECIIRFIDSAKKAGAAKLALAVDSSNFSGN